MVINLQRPSNDTICILVCMTILATAIGGGFGIFHHWETADEAYVNETSAALEPHWAIPYRRMMSYLSISGNDCGYVDYFKSYVESHKATLPPLSAGDADKMIAGPFGHSMANVIAPFETTANKEQKP